MAAEDVLIKFQTDLGDFKKQLDDVKSKMGGIDSKAKETGDKMSDSFKGAGDKIGNVLGGIGKALVAAFAVSKIIAFGKESLKAFQEAELAAKKLNVAVGVSGGTQAHFDRLIKQSKELEKISIFSDDTIQQVQTIALQFGLTADQVEKLLPLVADYASATGQDLAGAMQSVLVGTNGQMRALKSYGIVVKDAGNQTDNLANITEVLTQKFQGQAEIIAGTSLGKVKQLENSYNNLQESIGELIATGLTPFLEKMNTTLGSINETLSSESLSKWEKFWIIMGGQAGSLGKSAAAQDDFNKRLKDNLELSEKGTEQRKTAIKRINDEIVVLEKNRDKNIALFSTIEEKSIVYDVYAKKIDKLKEGLQLIGDGYDSNAAKAEHYKKVIATLEPVTKDLGDTIAELRLKIEEKKKALEAANTTNGDSIIATKALAAAEDNLTIALGKETDAQKKLREEKEKAAVAETKRMEDLKKQMEDSAAEDEKFASETIQRVKESTLTKEQLENERFENEKARLDHSQLTNEKSKEVLEALEKEHWQNISDIHIEQGEKNLREYEDFQNEKKKIAEEAAQQRAVIAEAEKDLALTTFDAIMNLQEQQQRDQTQRHISALDKEEAKKLKAVEERGEKELLSKEEIEKLKQDIEEDTARKRSDILRKQFESEKQAAIIRAIIEGLLATVVALRKGGAELALITAAASAVLVGAIAAQPTPQFHKGAIDIRRQNKNSKGEFAATLIEGESVIAPDATKRYRKELQAINSMKFEDLIFAKYIFPALQLQKKEFEKENNKSFAGNVAKSMMLNAKLNDGNIIEMLKRINSTSKESVRALNNLSSKRTNIRTNV